MKTIPELPNLNQGEGREKTIDEDKFANASSKNSLSQTYVKKGSYTLMRLSFLLSSPED